MASEQAILDRDLFLNLGLVQNLSLDLSDHLMIPKPLVVLRYLPFLFQINTFANNHTFLIFFSSDEDEESEKGDLYEGHISPKQVVRPTMKSVTEETPHELGNPVTSYSPNHPRAVFLHDLKIGHAPWRCTCDGIG